MTTLLFIRHPEPRRQRQSGSDRGTSRVRCWLRKLASVIQECRWDPSLALGMTEGWALCDFSSTRARSLRDKLRQNNLGRFREILCDPVGRTIGGVRFKTSADTNRFDSSIVPAVHINLFVANHN
jgi:hypothetical protein